MGNSNSISSAEADYLAKRGFKDTQYKVSTTQCSVYDSWGAYGGEACQSSPGDTRQLSDLKIGENCERGTSLAGFQLIRKNLRNSYPGSKPQWAYRYKCDKNDEQRMCQTRTTDFAEVADYSDGEFSDSTNGDVKLLSNHLVMCREGETLKDLKLEKSSDNDRIRYKYTCCENPTNNCLKMYTKWVNDKKGDPHNLRKADVMCPQGSLLNSVNLETNGDQFRYAFNCCVPINNVNCNAFYNKPQLWKTPDEQHVNNCPFWTGKKCLVGQTCGGTRETPDYVCLDVNVKKNNGRQVNGKQWIKVGEIPKLDSASIQKAEETLLRGTNTNYYQLCKYWLNNENPSKTWQNEDPDAKKCTTFCKNYIVYNPKSFKGRQSRTEIEGFPLWKIKGVEED